MMAFPQPYSKFNPMCLVFKDRLRLRSTDILIIPITMIPNTNKINHLTIWTFTNQQLFYQMLTLKKKLLLLCQVKSLKALILELADNTTILPGRSQLVYRMIGTHLYLAFSLNWYQYSFPFPLMSVDHQGSIAKLLVLFSSCSYPSFISQYA